MLAKKAGRRTRLGLGGDDGSGGRGCSPEPLLGGETRLPGVQRAARNVQGFCVPILWNYSVNCGAEAKGVFIVVLKIAGSVSTQVSLQNLSWV